MRVFKYTAIVWKESEGYVSKCPEFGVISSGDTFDEAVQNLREALQLYLENTQERGILEDLEESLSAKRKAQRSNQSKDSKASPPIRINYSTN